MKIYTRTGDDGTSGLFGGPRVSKSHPRLAAYGALDELSAALGVAIAADPTHPISRRYAAVQNELLTLGSHLATPPDSPHAGKLPRLEDGGGERGGWVERLEAEIDASEAQLPALTTFILPGGTVLAAQLHLARTVCRRAEREVIALAESGPGAVAPAIVHYLNRLSDHLFSHARLANHLSKVADVAWSKPG